MDFRLIQDAERQMLRDGKSAAAIDAMKSAYRKQMFNPDGYSQTAGLGSFASGGEAYGPPPVSGPVPQGIASFQEGGEADKVREFGNLEYEVEMNPFLEPISRAGFDPNVVKVMQNAGSHYNPNTDEIIIGNYTGTANLSEQAHEFRHRGLEKVASEFFLNIPTLKREMPPEDFKRLLNFFETMEEQRFRKRGVGGSFGRPGSDEYKFDRQEMIAEFFEEPYEYNLPAQYYAATGEDPASAKFQRVMNINPETKEPYTDEERAAYAARTGTVIKKMLLQDTVQDQMDRLETVGQDEFRTFAGADPETRTGDEIFKQAMLVQEFARKQNAAAKKYSDGGAVMNGIGTLNETARNMTRGPRGIGAYQQFADGGSVPRQTMIGNQPHMLAYINPEEAQLLQNLGGTGEPGPGGIPAYRPSDFAAERTGTGSYSNTSSSAAAANEAAAASMLSAGVGNVGGSTTYSDPFPNSNQSDDGPGYSNSNQSDDGPGYSTTASVVQPKPEPEPQNIMATLYDKSLDFFNPNSQAIAAMRGSGIKGNPNDPRNQGLTMFPGPISLGLKGLAYLGGIRKTDPIVKVTDDKNVYQTGSGSFYIINSVTGLPMMVESPDDLSLSSDARARTEALMTDMNKSDNESGPGSCGPGYVYNYSAGACVPMIGTAATSASDVLYADDFTPAGGNTVVPNPVYLPVGMAEGGIVNVSGLAQIGMGFPGGPPMPGGGFGGGYAAMPSQMPRVPQELPSVQQPFPGMIQAPEQVPNLFQPEYKQRFGTLMNSNPLQQYGGYLEQQYGDPGFDQKKNQFLQEVLQKEQQTFGGNLLQPSNFQPGFMGGGPTAVNPTPTAFPAAFPMPGSNPSHYLSLQAPGNLLQGFAEGGEVEEPLSEYQRALIASESSGRSNVVNELGYKGLTQAGDAAISDFKDQEGLNFSDEEYLNSPALQMQFQRWYEQKTINYVMDKGLDAYIGKVIKGVPITMSALLGMAHIGGDFGMQQFLETGGRYDPNDGKTSLSDYGRKFANMAVYGESGGENFNRVTPEDALMSMPVEQEGSLAFYRPRARPPEIEFSAPATSLRPMARPEELTEPELEQIDVSLQPSRPNLMEKYSLANMAEALTQQEPVGIMSATR